MLIKKKIILGVVLAIILSAVLTQPALAGDGPVQCPHGSCGVGATDPGAPGGSGSGAEGIPPISSGDSGGASQPPPCVQVLADPQPPVGTVFWEGHTESEGAIYVWKCSDGDPGDFQSIPPRFIANGAAAAPPVDPAVLARQAYAQIPRIPPVMRWGPDPDHVAVLFWLYLWLDNQQPDPVTVTAGGVSVTATARITSVKWSMGSPIDADHLRTPAPPVTCKGLGKQPPNDLDRSLEASPLPAPYCAFMYTVRSTAERTNGRRTWPVTATASWEVDWTTTSGPQAGLSGVFVAPPLTSTTAVCVGAYRAVMVAPDYVPPADGGKCRGGE